MHLSFSSIKLLQQPYRSRPPIFALIIGINKYHYERVRNLRGAVADADDLESYLRETLEVPVDQIRNLRNESATRSAIIKALNDLICDARIRMGDAIIIFYAGHGGETKAPPGWDTETGKIQYILPCDIKTKDKDGSEIRGIPDRTLAIFLNTLAEVKGDNIVSE